MIIDKKGQKEMKALQNQVYGLMREHFDDVLETLGFIEMFKMSLMYTADKHRLEHDN